MSANVKITEDNTTNKDNGKSLRLVSGTVTYPMAVTKQFIAIRDEDDNWSVTDEEGKPVRGAMEADVLRSIEAQTS